MKHTSQTVQQWTKYLYPNEIPALKELAKSLPDNPIVINIGAGNGTSALTFMESRPDLIVYTIDIQDLSSPFGCLQGEREVMKSAGYGDDPRWHQIHADSKNVGKFWSEGVHGCSDKVDMVFVDGDHSMKGIIGDIGNWFPNIKEGGILAIHDYKKGDLPHDTNGPHPRPWPDVDKAVDTLLLGFYEVALHVDSLIAFRVTHEESHSTKENIV